MSVTSLKGCQMFMEDAAKKAASVARNLERVSSALRDEGLEKGGPAALDKAATAVAASLSANMELAHAICFLAEQLGNPSADVLGETDFLYDALATALGRWSKVSSWTGSLRRSATE